MISGGSLPEVFLLTNQPTPPADMKGFSLFKCVNFKTSDVFLLLKIELSVDCGFSNLDTPDWSVYLT